MTPTPKRAAQAAMSDRLLVLLRYAKSENRGSTWRDVAAALGDLYHPDMTLSDAVHHIVAAFTEALAEPRFEVGRGGTAGVDLLLAPIKGHHSVEALGPSRLDTSYTVEQFYNAQVAYVLGQLSIAKIGWCRDWFAGTASSPAAMTATSSDWNMPVFARPGAGMSILATENLIESGAKRPDIINAIRNSIASIFNALGDIALEEIVLTFRTRSGEDLLINPFDQSSIDAAKEAAPGEGVGPAVVTRLLDLMARGLIKDATVLPSEYRHLGALIGTTETQAKAVLANCNPSFRLDVRP